MTFLNLIFEKKNAIAYVTVNRPKALNALNAATIAELQSAFTEIQRDTGTRVVILTGAGEKAFVAGADIGEIAHLNEAGGKELAVRGQGVFNLIEHLGKPVIACVNGFALGGGCELAMACTLRLASESAKFGQPEVKLGIIPGYGGTQRLPRLIGKGRALQLMLTGEMIGAQEALRVGLVNEVVAPGELMARAEAIAQKILSNGPIAVRHVLRAVNQGLDQTLEEGQNLEAELFSACCATSDKQEGTSAFLEKRPAQFHGR